MSNAASSYSKRSVASWALYDFANSPFTTLMVTFIYPVFFAQVIVGDEIRGTALWSRGVTATALMVAALSPFLGALADRGGYRKLFLGISTLVSILGCVWLFFLGPGQIWPALIGIVLANTAFEMGMVFYNAFLPDIAPANRIGRISGIGWALGYIGGLLALAIALVALVQPEVPWFGLSTEGGQHIRASSLIVAGWFFLFSLPLFLFVREDRSQVRRGPGLLAETSGQLAQTFRELKKYRQIVRFLLARLFFNDGLVTVFAFGGIYAAGTFGFEVDEILMFGIVLNLTAGFGAFALGFLDDILGGKKTIVLTLIGLSIASLMAVLAPNRAWFWAAGVLLGIFVGPNQAASRSLMGRLVPPDKENEFFGFFAFSGKLTAFLGPLLLGILTTAFDSQRAGISVVLALFLLGLVVLLPLNEEEGIALAERDA